MSESITREKAKKFAVKIVTLTRELSSYNGNYILANQVLRSGTSIGANISEAEHGQSRADFINKMNIALKEANETRYWLEILTEADCLDKNKGKNLMNDCEELIRLLVAIVKTTKQEY
jgi:four helix bundle protein